MIDLPAERLEVKKAACDRLASLMKRGEAVDGQVFEIADVEGPMPRVECPVLQPLPFRSVLRLPS